MTAKQAFWLGVFGQPNEETSARIATLTQEQATAEISTWLTKNKTAFLDLFNKQLVREQARVAGIQAKINLLA